MCVLLNPKSFHCVLNHMFRKYFSKHSGNSPFYACLCMADMAKQWLTESRPELVSNLS